MLAQSKERSDAALGRGGTDHQANGLTCFFIRNPGRCPGLERFPQCCGIIINRCSPQREQGPLADTQKWFGPCSRCGLTKMIAVLEHRGNRSNISQAFGLKQCDSLAKMFEAAARTVPFAKNGLRAARGFDAKRLRKILLSCFFQFKTPP